MRKRVNQVILCIGILVGIISIFLFIRLDVLVQGYFLKPTYSMNAGGITMEVEDLIITEDRFSVIVKATRDDGEKIGEWTLPRGYKWDGYGLDSMMHSGYGSYPSFDVSELFWIIQGEYESVKNPGYLMCTIKDLSYQRPKDAKWIVRYKGPWKLSIPLKATYPTINKTVDAEILIGSTIVKLKYLRFDTLGVTLGIERVLLDADTSLKPLNDAYINQKDGSQIPLGLVKRPSGNEDQEIVELKYIILNDTSTNIPSFSTIDILNIQSIVVNGEKILVN
nr:hypothetical protein [uncultured Niameybacter sp.]